MSFIPVSYSENAGFTLVEIMIVIIIIGILATIGMGGFQSSQLKGRDAERKSDLKQIANSLETYYNDKGEYPLSSAGKIAGCNGGNVCEWGAQFSDENDTVYMIALPEDPRSNLEYYYDSPDGRSYQLYARLENTLDAAVPTDVNDVAQVYATTVCGADACNYGIASSNTTPVAGKSLVAD
jgi:general secretion pathway protein G